MVATLATLPGPHLRRGDVRGMGAIELLLATASDDAPIVALADESIFAPHMGTVGCVSVRGPAIREVLTNANDFLTLRPDVDDLPDDVARLSASVFSEGEPLHGLQRADVRRLMRADVDAAIVERAISTALDGWSGEAVGLTEVCRDTAYAVWGPVWFGSGEAGRLLGDGVRRVVDAAAGAADGVDRPASAGGLVTRRSR